MGNRDGKIEKKDRLKSSYKKSKDFYDDLLTQKTWWAKLYFKVFWSGVDDVKVANKVLSFIPDDFMGKVLDVPVGTAVFTYKKFKRLKYAEIIGLDYSEDMLEKSRIRFIEHDVDRVKLVQGDVGDLPYGDRIFDIVISMNGIHVFPDKDGAFNEIYRVLKPGGKFIGCFIVEGKSKITDFLTHRILVNKGWMSMPFETESSFLDRVEKDYLVDGFEVRGSMLIFSLIKKG